MCRPTPHGRATPSSRPPDPASSPLGWHRGPPGRHRFHLRPGAQSHARRPAGYAGLGSARRHHPHDGWRPRRTLPNRARQTVPPVFRATFDQRRRPFGPGRTARWTSGGEARTALAAAARQDRAAGPGSHTDPEPVGLRAVTVVRLVGTFPLGHLGPLDAKAGARPASRRVYGAPSTQDKGLDNRKCVKTPFAARAVEKPGAIFRPAFPPGRRGARSARRQIAFP